MTDGPAGDALDPHAWDVRATAREREASRRRGVRRLAHLFALSSFAFAAPLFVKLGEAPGYFAAHGFDGSDVVLFALALLVIPPLVLALIELVARIPGRRVRWAVHLVIVAILVALTVLPPLGVLPTGIAYAAAIGIGVGFALAYARWRNVRSFTSALAFAPVLFAVWFLLISPTSELVGGEHLDAWGAESSPRPPVVFIQFDALPGLLLETKNHEVDAVRFPNFARLARDGVWYRNASNVHENTVFSVPSFVDGRIPRKGVKPVVQDHYPNLFTLLGPGYRMNVAEEATTLCPYEYCRDKQRTGSFLRDTRAVYNQIIRPKDARSTLPSISHRWTDFVSGPAQTTFATRKKTPEYVIRHLKSGRIGRFERWLNDITGGGELPELNYIHIFLPHEPREFLPDGHRYVSPDGVAGPPSYDDRFLSEQAIQMTILQLGYTDRVVGQVIHKLERLGVYDDALFVVVADHGESFLPEKATPAGPFVPGHLGYRRAVTERNVADIASVPMFVKYPEGTGPRGTDDRFVRAVDVLPTIGQLLNLELPRLSGRSLLNRGYRGHDDIYVGSTFDEAVRLSTGQWQRERQRSLTRRLDLFGQGKDSLWRWGPNAELVGDRAVATAPPDPLVKATVTDASELQRVDAGGIECPCHLSGRIAGADPAGMQLAIAVNGRIAATGVGFGDRGKQKLNWAVLVPPSAFHDGRNSVDVLRIDAGGGLTPLGGA